MRSCIAAALGCVLAGCPSPPTSPRLDAGPPPPRRVDVVVLGNDRGTLLDRAPALAAQLRAEAGWPDALVLSIGSSFSGTALADVFEGAPIAEAMKALGVAALTVGPRDLDFGSARFAQLREASGATLLLSTVRDRDGALGPSSTFARFEKGKVKVGVIGVADVGGGDGAFDALPLEGALASTVAMATQQDAEVVVALVAGCSTGVRALLDSHPDWRLDLVVAKACPDTSDGRVGATTVLHLDSTRPQVAHLWAEWGPVRSLSARLLDETRVPEAPDVAVLRKTFAARLEEKRQEPLGFVRAEVPKADVARLVARALKETKGAQAGLFVRAGVRSGLPAGAVLRGHLLDAVPGFDRVLLVDVPGEVLTKLVSHPDAVLELPPKVAPYGSYVLATTEPLYRTGIGLEAVDANPVDARQLLGPLVEAWFTGLGTTADQPLRPPPSKQNR